MNKILIAFILGITLYSGTALAEIVPIVRAGSSRSRVAEVQRALNECGDIYLKPDGIWGSRTASAVRAFQRNNGIAQVGYVGSLTAQELNTCFYGSDNSSDDEDVTPNYNPAGQTVPSQQLCSNGKTFASNCTVSPLVTNTNTIGQVCPNGMTLASNCTVFPANIPNSVALCPNGATVASNCTQTYNSNTGTNYGQTYSNVEGSLVSVTRLASYGSTRLYEGDRDIPVLGIQAIARDADQRVEGFVVSLRNSNTSSNQRITRYASDISVWLDGREIGRKSALSYSDESSDYTYTYRFTGMNGVIPRDKIGQIVVAVSAVAPIDSSNASNDAWTISAGSSTTASGDGNFISAASPNGRYRDYGSDPSGSTFTTTLDFEKAGGLNSVQRFRISPASNNPLDQTVQVSDASDTYDKLLLAFDARAEGSRMLVQRIPVVLTATGNGVGVSPYVSAVVRSLKFYADGVKIAEESIPTGATTATVVFGQYSKLNHPISQNSTTRFEVRADYYDIEPGTGNPATEFDNGDKVSAKISSGELTSAIIELDNYFQDTVYNRTGSVIGGNQTLRSYGAQPLLGTVTSDYSSNGSGEIISRTIRIPVRVRALDNSVYLSPNIENALTPSTTASIGYIFEDASGNQKTITHSATLASLSAPVQSGVYRVDAGTEREFLLTIVLTGSTGNTQNQYRVQLGFINSYSDVSLSGTQSLQILEPANLYETPFYTLNLN
jgi:peptidoglycan hydrolase-like protein with peptidoglycan-binding domain